MATVYSYVRFSSKPQEKGDSLRRQKAMGDAWLGRHPEHVLDTTLRLTDLGVSAFKGANLDKDKGDLGRFIHLAAQGQIEKGSILMLENLDRFSRQPPRKAYKVFCDLVEAGVKVLTLEPEQLIDEGNVDSMEVVLPVIIKMQLSFEESRKKAERLKAVWTEKRKKTSVEKLTSLAPKWLRLSKDGRTFETIPERVKILRSVFEWAKNGQGATAIVKRLEAESVPTWGKAKFWQVSYIKKLLHNRAVLGEFQPHRMQDGKRIPTGEPISDYYPAVIDRPDFYAVQRSLGEHKSQPGRHGKRLTNLFTGLLLDARDGSNLNIVDKGDGPMLVSSAAKAGKRGSVYISFPYAPFEQSLLIWGYGLKLDDVLPKRATDLEQDLQKAQGKMEDLEHRIETVKEKIATAGDLDALLDTLVTLETKRKEAHQTVERCRRELTTQTGEARDRVRQLVEKLKTAKKPEAYELRVRLRATLKRLIENIVVLVVQVNRDRVAIADVLLKSGHRRQVTVMPRNPVTLPAELDGLDVREWTRWPKESRKTRFSVVSDVVQKMMALEDAGCTRSEIAVQLGISKSQVSRGLGSQGRRKLQRKSDERLMTWHPRGRGWVKRQNGKRHFIGLGKLQAMYPTLVTEKTEEGSWRAANRWWQDQLRGQEKASAVTGT